MDAREWGRRALIAMLVASIAGVLAMLAIYASGVYGIALFIGVPLFLGFSVTALMALGRPRTLGQSFLWSVLTAFVLSLAFLVTGREGLICIVMALPLALPPILLGSLGAWTLFHRRRLARAREGVIAAAVIVAMLISVEASLRPAASGATLVVSDDVDIAAAPEEVWRTIVTLGEIEPPRDMIFRAGAACPQRTKIVAGEPGGLRVCTLSTGTLLERIDRWEPGRRLAWQALSTPAPMRELNPFRDADPPHLHGFYRNVRGEFELTRTARGTRLTRRTWYQQDLYPAFYWRLWCDFGASRVHRLVLGHVRAASERRGGSSV
jgi:hypothetical protein